MRQDVWAREVAAYVEFSSLHTTLDATIDATCFAHFNDFLC